MAQPLQLEKRDLALRGAEPPPFELPVDGFSKPLKHILRFAIPSPRILTPSARLGPRFGELEIEPRRSPPCGGHLPPMQTDAGQRKNEDPQLERLQPERLTHPEFDGEIGRHQRGDQNEEDD